jgi:choline-sulfatase
MFFPPPEPEVTNPLEPTNLLFLFSDQHNRAFAGCYGHPVVKTPNLDSLAARGVRFTNAYCNCPICVPSRASLATGRYCHQIGSWDNAFPYTGDGYRSWGHRLVERGHHVTTIGKLHYRDPKDPSGFPDQRIPMHVLDGKGDLYSLLRDEAPARPQLGEKVLQPKVGESSYTSYDTAICKEACRWLAEESAGHGKPWVLFVSFSLPHHPLIAPQEYIDLYPPEEVVFPAQYSLDERPRHPALEELRRVLGLEGEADEMTVRRAVATYYAMCTYLDRRIGEVLSALADAGLTESTRIMYSSDHGDLVGEHGLWMKHNMYEGSAGVPFIMAGPGIPAGKVVPYNISLVDCYPTILECVGVPLRPDDSDLPGTSLFPIAKGESAPDRTAFSEYHAIGSKSGIFMIRNRRYKYVEYVGDQPQLFDLEDDPGELRDLAADPEFGDVLAACVRELREICDPVEVDRRAKADQEQKIEENGGREAVRAEGFKIAYTPAPSEFRKQGAVVDP